MMPVEPSGADVLERLQHVCEGKGLPELAAAIRDVGAFVGRDLDLVEGMLRAIPHRSDLVGRSAEHLLGLAGKRIRPICVALSARVGAGFGRGALHLAAAAELVHSATLLHDDVVDAGATRRGEPTARVLYGNAASVFAGDWLLIEALRHVRAAAVPGVLDALLSTIDAMIRAESLQLEVRGRLLADRDAYFRIIEGKTASLFRWAALAGGTAGGLGERECEALEDYGLNLGLAFQLIDDALDLAGDPSRTGKSIRQDIREGKMTYPLLVGLERDPSLGSRLEGALTSGDARLEDDVVQALSNTGAIEATFVAAREYSRRARSALEALPNVPARASLAWVSDAAVARSA